MLWLALIDQVFTVDIYISEKKIHNYCRRNLHGHVQQLRFNNNSISALMLPQCKSEEMLKPCVWGALHGRRHVYMCATDHALLAECGVHILLCIS